MRRAHFQKYLLLVAAAVAMGGFLYLSLERKKELPQAGLSSIQALQLAKNEDKLREAIKEFGIKSLMEKLVEESAGGSKVDCHQESHNIGRVGYELYKQKAFQECNASCHSGCYHGAMESLLNEKGAANLAANINEVCKLFETSFGKFECLHGVGHGVLAYLDYDMPQAIIECKKLEDSFAQSSCYGGMFMENVLTGQGLGAARGADKQIHETPWVNKTDPYFPCNKIDQSFPIQYQCYQMQTSWMLTMYNYNFDIVKDKCLNAPENMIAVCFKSLGRDAAGQKLRDPEKIMQICNKVPELYYNDCVIGALNVIVDFWGPALKEQATELCKLLPQQNKKNCYETLAERFDGVFAINQERRNRCETFETEYQYLCKPFSL